jgi:hypothetical protein
MLSSSVRARSTTSISTSEGTSLRQLRASRSAATSWGSGSTSGRSRGGASSPQVSSNDFDFEKPKTSNVALPSKCHGRKPVEGEPAFEAEAGEADVQLCLPPELQRVRRHSDVRVRAKA